MYEYVTATILARQQADDRLRHADGCPRPGTDYVRSGGREYVRCRRCGQTERCYLSVSASDVVPSILIVIALAAVFWIWVASQVAG